MSKWETVKGNGEGRRVDGLGRRAAAKDAATAKATDNRRGKDIMYFS